MLDLVDLRMKGHVRLRSRGELVLDQHNLVVDSAYEGVLRALTGVDTIGAVVFANSGGIPAAPGLRGLINPVATAAIGQDAETKPYITRDARGRKAVCTWTALLQPSVDMTYDSLGLTTVTGLLFAVTTFAARTAVAGDDIAVQWTINL